MNWCASIGSEVEVALKSVQIMNDLDQLYDEKLNWMHIVIFRKNEKEVGKKKWY